MTRDNASLLVVTSSVTGQFKDFCRKVFEDSGEINWSTGTNALCVVALPQ